MARKKRTPEEQERRAKIRELFQIGGISSMDDIQNLFKETIAEFMKSSLEVELDKEPDQHQSGHRRKDTLHVRKRYDYQ